MIEAVAKDKNKIPIAWGRGNTIADAKLNCLVELEKYLARKGETNLVRLADYTIELNEKRVLFI